MTWVFHLEGCAILEIIGSKIDSFYVTSNYSAFIGYWHYLFCVYWSGGLFLFRTNNLILIFFQSELCHKSFKNVNCPFISFENKLNVSITSCTCHDFRYSNGLAITGISLGMHPANERSCYKVISGHVSLPGPIPRLFPAIKMWQVTVVNNDD